MPLSGVRTVRGPNRTFVRTLFGQCEEFVEKQSNICLELASANSGKAGNFFVQPAQKLLTMLVDFVQNVEIHICAMCTKIINIVSRFCTHCTKRKELCNLHKNYQQC